MSRTESEKAMSLCALSASESGSREHFWCTKRGQSVTTLEGTSEIFHLLSLLGK